MTEPSPPTPSEIDQLLGLVREHHSRLHQWHGRGESLVTTEGVGARCVGVRCYLEPELFRLLESHLEAQGMATHCCAEEELPSAMRQGWELLHLQPEFGGVEFVVEERTVLFRQT